jgi:N-acetylglucosamine-6-phosphate deacetylase
MSTSGTDCRAFVGARIFDGEIWHDDAALVTRDAKVEGIVAADEIPPAAETTKLDGGILAPGFVDLQVNGGGGVMLNDRQDVEAIRTICAAHAPFGTTALLVTLITDTPEITVRAVDACAAALEAGVPGLLGLHLEGPHLSVARKGAHDPRLIRPMTAEDQAFVIASRARVPVLLSTVARESVEPAQARALADAGVTVSIGHTDTTYAGAAELADAGASMATHLFNAMSQITNREPGVAGAVLDIGTLDAGLIADGIHVDPVSIGIALRAKNGPGRIFLVTDAMATIGTDMASFTLNGRTIFRKDGSLRLADGTLAGADLDMISAVRFMHEKIGLPIEEALRMATLYPARAVRAENHVGRLGAGTDASLVHLSDALAVQGVWIRGDKVFG